MTPDRKTSCASGVRRGTGNCNEPLRSASCEHHHTPVRRSGPDSSRFDSGGAYDPFRWRSI